MKINILISINIGKFFFQWYSIFSYPYSTTRDISRIPFVDPVYHSPKPPWCMSQPNGLKMSSNRCKHIALHFYRYYLCFSPFRISPSPNLNITVPTGTEPIHKFWNIFKWLCCIKSCQLFDNIFKFFAILILIMTLPPVLRNAYKVKQLTF